MTLEGRDEQLNNELNRVDKMAHKKANEFHDELVSLLNRYSQENHSDTPDFILADYLESCLEAYNFTVKEREKWYGRKCGDGAAIL